MGGPKPHASHITLPRQGGGNWLISLVVFTLIGCRAPRIALDSGTVVDAGDDASTAAIRDAGTINDAGTVTVADAGLQDAGADAGTPTPCAIAADPKDIPDPRSIQSATCYDQLMTTIAAASTAADRQHAADAFVTTVSAAGGFPARDSTHAIFCTRTAIDHAPPNLAGDWNSWSTNAEQLSRVGDTDLVCITHTFNIHERHAYKFVAPGLWFNDALNPWMIWDGIVPTPESTYNSVVALAGSTLDAADVWHAPALSSKLLGDERREIYVHLPQAYFSGTAARFPALYTQDGNEAITEGGFEVVAANEIAAGRVAPFIGVYLPLHDVSERMLQYSVGSAGSTGEAYGGFVATEAAPWIDTHMRTLARPESRATSGVSLGGFIAVDIAWEHADVFGLTASQSGSFFWNADCSVNPWSIPDGINCGSRGGDLVNAFKNTPKKALRIYLDSGTPGDNAPSNEDFAAVLSATGYDYLQWEAPGAQHAWPDWALRYPKMLAFLFPPAK